MSMLLDLVEVTESHSGVNLANAFAKVLSIFPCKRRSRENARCRQRPNRL